MIRRAGILILMLASWAVAAVPTTQRVQTAHYDLEAEVAPPQAVKMAALLEAYFSQASAYFGATPAVDERLRIVVLADFERFIQRLKDDGRFAEIARGADGAYCENNRTIYLTWTEPSALMHDLLLHEATHQFCALVRKSKPKSSVYEEGVAEFLGHHRWDGSRLVLGVAPQIEPHDRPAEAQERFQTRFGRDVSRVVLEQESAVAHYADAWAVYSFLHDEEPGRLKIWARMLDEGKDAVAAWRAAMDGTSEESISAQYAGWLAGRQWKWECLSGAWGQESDWIEGASRRNTVGIALMKAPVDDVTVEIEVQNDFDQAGLAIGFTSREQGTLLNLLGSGELRTIELVDGKIETERLPLLKHRRGWRWTMRMRREREEMIVSVDGKDCVRTKAPVGSRCGVSVVGSARFRLVEGPAGSRPRP